jgi:hypothetical protein
MDLYNYVQTDKCFISGYKYKLITKPLCSGRQVSADITFELVLPLPLHIHLPFCWQAGAKELDKWEVL